MGRVIPSGSIFAPRLETRRIQQGRIPLSERLAERYLSPTGVAQTAALVGAIPIPEGVSRYFMGKKDAPETPAQKVAQARIGEPPAEEYYGQRTPSRSASMQRGTGAPTPAPAEEARVQEAIAPVRRVLADVIPGDSKAFAEAPAGQAAQVPGQQPMPPLHPQGTPETYLIQQRLIDKGLMTPEQIIGGEGRMGPLTTAALQQEAQQRAVQQRAAPEDLRQVEAPQEMVAEPYVPGTIDPVPAATAEPLVDEPTAPQTAKDRFERMLVQAGDKSFDAGMNFMRIAAKQADTPGDQALVLNSLELVDIPPRTIGDFLTGAHKDRFRKEVMGLMPKISKAKAVSDLDRAREAQALAAADLSRERGRTERERRKKIREEANKLERLRKGIGGKGGSKQRKAGLQRFDKQAAILNSNIDKQYTAKNAIVRQHKAEYDRLKDANRVAASALKTAQKQFDSANIEQSELTDKQTAANEASEALTKFDASTGYKAATREVADLRRQLAELNRLTAEVNQKGMVDESAWARLHESIGASGKSVAGREQEAERARQRAAKLIKDAEVEAQNRRKEEEFRVRREEIRPALEEYRESDVLPQHFREHYQGAGIPYVSRPASELSDDDLFKFVTYISRGSPMGWLQKGWESGAWQKSRKRQLDLGITEGFKPPLVQSSPQSP